MKVLFISCALLLQTIAVQSQTARETMADYEHQVKNEQIAEQHKLTEYYYRKTIVRLAGEMERRIDWWSGVKLSADRIWSNESSDDVDVSIVHRPYERYKSPRPGVGISVTYRKGSQVCKLSMVKELITSWWNLKTETGSYISDFDCTPNLDDSKP